jgi:OmpA-OmpF porin, OOP family
MRSVIGLCLNVVWVLSVQAGDLPGSSDHPLIPRYEGAEIIGYATQAFTDKAFLRGPAKAYGGLGENAEATLVLEGKLTQLTYRAPPERTPLEVQRNYQQALQDAGFELLFSCEREECGGRNFNHAVTSTSPFREYQQDQRYLLAKLARPQGDVYAALYVVLNQDGGGPNRGRSLVQLEVLEQQAMEQRMVVVEAPAMQADIDARGKVALYGILFDFDQASMRADSAPQLEEIARLLKASPALRVLVVGHSDAKGALDYNRELSQRRAQSIVKALVEHHGIAGERLTAVGVGMAAPLASNRSEEGRALNRRVELVERPE